MFDLELLFQKTSALTFGLTIAGVAFVIGFLMVFAFWLRHMIGLRRDRREQARLRSEIATVRGQNEQLSEQVARRVALAKIAASQRESTSGSANSAMPYVRRTAQVSGKGASVAQLPPVEAKPGESASAGEGFDWGKFPEITPAVAAKLNEMGIKDPAHLASLPPAERDALEAKLSFDGHKWDWNWLNNWKTAATGLAAGAVGLGVAGAVSVPGKGSKTAPFDKHAAQQKIVLPHTDGPKIDWSKTKGVDPALAAELKLIGIQNTSQLEALPRAERKKLEARLAARGLKWDWGWLSGWKAGDVTARPSEPMAGVGSKIATAKQEFKPFKAADKPVFKMPAVSGKDVDWSTVDGVDLRSWHQNLMCLVSAVLSSWNRYRPTNASSLSLDCQRRV